MGLFDWLSGKRSQPAPSAPRPRLISALEEDSPFVVLDTG
jgi:hypothetical protein